MYLDNVEESMSYYDAVDEPYNYIKYTPMLFNRWLDWAKKYKVTDNDTLRPMGIKLGPDWMKQDFDNLNTFYLYYISLTQDDG